MSGANYEIEIYCYYAKTGAGTVTWTLTNSAVPTSMSVVYEMSPATGVSATPAAPLGAAVLNSALAATVIGPTASLSAANHYAHFKIWLQNGTGTSLKLNATESATTITPGIGSYYRVRRMPATSTGTFN